MAIVQLDDSLGYIRGNTGGLEVTFTKISMMTLGMISWDSTQMGELGRSD